METAAADRKMAAAATVVARASVTAAATVSGKAAAAVSGMMAAADRVMAAVPARRTAAEPRCVRRSLVIAETRAIAEIVDDATQRPRPCARADRHRRQPRSRTVRTGSERCGAFPPRPTATTATAAT